MKRPIESDYTSHAAYTRALESYCDTLAKPEQEPVAWMWDVNNGGGYTSRNVGLYQTDIPFAKHTPLYTTPPQRTWGGLTAEERLDIWTNTATPMLIAATEAKLKEKNT